LRKGARIIVDGTPFEILESMPLKKAQRRVVIQTRIKNLISGSVMDRNFHQGDVFEEAELTKINIKFLYTHRNKYFFCEEDDPSKRFDLDHSVLGQNIKFLKPNSIIEGIVFDGKIINVSLPIKIQVKVTESPPGVRGDRAQGGTKIVRIETGAEINVPLFIEEGNIIEINTETGEYVKKIE
jgi:elongation factor P